MEVEVSFGTGLEMGIGLEVAARARVACSSSRAPRGWPQTRSCAAFCQLSSWKFIKGQLSMRAQVQEKSRHCSIVTHVVLYCWLTDAPTVWLTLQILTAFKVGWLVGGKKKKRIPPYGNENMVKQVRNDAEECVCSTGRYLLECSGIYDSSTRKLSLTCSWIVHEFKIIYLCTIRICWR